MFRFCAIPPLTRPWDRLLANHKEETRHHSAIAWLLFCWNDMKWITLLAPRGEITRSTPALLTMPGCQPANHWLAHVMSESLACSGSRRSLCRPLWATPLLTWATWAYLGSDRWMDTPPLRHFAGGHLAHQLAVWNQNSSCMKNWTGPVDLTAVLV